MASNCALFTICWSKVVHDGGSRVPFGTQPRSGLIMVNDHSSLLHQSCPLRVDRKGRQGMMCVCVRYSRGAALPLQPMIWQAHDMTVLSLCSFSHSFLFHHSTAFCNGFTTAHHSVMVSPQHIILSEWHHSPVSKTSLLLRPFVTRDWSELLKFFEWLILSRIGQYSW